MSNEQENEWINFELLKHPQPTTGDSNIKYVRLVVQGAFTTLTDLCFKDENDSSTAP